MADWFYQRGYNERTVYHEESDRDFGDRTYFYRDSTGYSGYRPDFICCSPELPSYDVTSCETTEEIEQRNSLQLTALEDRLQSIERKMDLLADGLAKFKKTFEDGLAKVLKRLDALIEEQNGKEVTPESEFVLGESAHGDDIGGIEEAAIKTEETTKLLEDIHASGTNEEEPIQLSNSENFGREISSAIEIQNIAETEKLMNGIANDHLVEEYLPTMDLLSWKNYALNLFDKMPNNYYYLEEANGIGLNEVAGFHTRSEGFGTLFGKIIDTNKDSVGAIFVFDPGGRDFNLSLRSTLRTRWKFGGPVMLHPVLGGERQNRK